MKANLEKTLSIVAGTAIEVTINLTGGATFSFDGKNESAVSKIKSFFKKELEVEYDEECDFTCIYMKL